MSNYLEKVDNVNVDDDERLFDEVDDSVANGDVGFNHLSYDNAPGVMKIAHQGVGLDVHCNLRHNWF
jgi:hypothetical protein